MSSPIQHTGDRLPGNVQPVHYDLVIKSDLQNLIFDGLVKIHLRFDEPISNVVLHADKSLDIQRVVASFKDSSVIREAAGVQRDDNLQQINIQFEEPITPESGASLCIKFHGEITSTMSGYYKNSFTKDGKESCFALTNFEPTSARKALPCFDEPSMKATFKMTMISRKGLASLSNTHIIDTFHSDGDISSVEDFCSSSDIGNIYMDGELDWTVTKFASTPKMSTYLLAYANGDFKHIESSFVSMTDETVPVRFYGLENQIQDATYALEVATKVVPIYERLFDIPYPLKKLDVLISTNFEMGAMENWGLIIGRAKLFLGEEKRSPVSVIKNICTTICHEISHQWFGNIVTMEFWDGLWLNESFATYIGELIVTDKLHPEWGVEADFLSGRRFKGSTDMDSLRSSHPVEVECNDSRQAAYFFDRISYGKGASILRQLSNYIGMDTFMKGVSIYLKNNLYGSTKTSDLWKGISEASGIDITTMMENWISKVGHPVLTVTEEDNGIRVRQNRFIITGDVKPEEDETLWKVPLEIKYLDEETGKMKIERKHVLEDREIFIQMKSTALKTFKLNSDTTCYYRTLYSPERWLAIANEFSNPQCTFSINDKIGILQDLNLLCLAGYIKLPVVMELIVKIKNETEFNVLVEIAQFLDSVCDVFWENERLIKAVHKSICDVFEPLYQRIGFEDMPDETSKELELRALVLSMLTKISYEPVVTEIQRRFLSLLQNDDRTLVPESRLSLILSGAVRFGGTDEYEKVQEIHRNPKTSHDTMACAEALSKSENETLIKRTFDMILNEEIADQNIMHMFKYISQNDKAKRKLFQFFKDNFGMFNKKFHGQNIMRNYISYSTAILTTEEDLDDVTSFYDSITTTSFQAPVDQAISNLKKNIEWINRENDNVRKWLDQM